MMLFFGDLHFIELITYLVYRKFIILTNDHQMVCTWNIHFQLKYLASEKL